MFELFLSKTLTSQVLHLIIELGNIVTDDDKFICLHSFKEFKPKTKEELLTLDMAETLDDRESLSLYVFYANKYPENELRRILSEVRGIPDSKIRKSKAALFNHLINEYAQQNNDNPGD